MTSQPFVVVNREPAYLKKSALAYVRAHYPEQAVAVSRWYDQHGGPQMFASGSKKKRLSGQKKMSKRHVTSRVICIDYHMAWPIERGRFWISSPFGPRKKRDGSRGFHSGMDLAALRGTPVHAAGQGKVIEAGYCSGYGNTVVIAHTPRYKTRYAHLHSILIQGGQRVQCGQKIGMVGSTGHVRKSGKDASHLHFEVYADKRQVNPLYFLV